jgi:hypothetical protein
MITFNFKKWDTLLGWSVFAIALLVYSLTVEPTLSFWDCGEYIPTAAKLEVGHPPGAPLFQMLGAFFAMFATSKEKVALMVNMVSVFSSAFTILFMYWSMTMLLKNLVAKFSEINTNNSIAILGASGVASLAFAFSDSFWYNAVEAEVYAMASLFIALLMWLGLRWEQDMHTPRGNRWLLIISLIVGLSFGVHFMALLTIPSIGLIYFFKNYKNVTIKSFLIANVVIIAILLFIFKLLLPYTLAIFGKTEIFMVNSLGLPFNSGTIFIFMVMVSSFYFGLSYTKKKNLPLFNTMLLSVLFILIGFSTWMMLPIRANANTVINENRPSDAAEVLAYYNREQYGDQKLFYGPMYTETYVGTDKDQPYEDEKPNYQRDEKTGKYIIVNNYVNAVQNGDNKQKGFMPRMWSTSPGHIFNYMVFSKPPGYKMDPAHDYVEDLYTMGYPIEEMSEEEVGVESAKLRQQTEGQVAQFTAGYHSGKFGFKEYDKFLQNFGQYLVIEKPSFTDNMQFMFEYQFGYMYWRYLMWNFSGRQNDVQGHYDSLDGNWMTGISALDSPRLVSQDNLPPDMANNKGRNLYFMLPFLLGVIGFIFHAKKDPKSFYVILALFLFTGIALKIYLNERPFEPRERDYALVGSFYAFALWICIGVYAIYHGLSKYLQPKISGPVVIAVTLLAAPVLMASQNWDDHDRSGKYTALAMAKAYLSSCEPNAILFTIGDNDTFPLWYAQEVEGYRTDVRIVNSSLITTDWYIDQMKAKAYNSDPMPIRFKHEQYQQGTRDFILYAPTTEQRIDVNQLLDFIALDTVAAQKELRNGHMVNFYPTNKVRLAVDKNQVIKSKIVSPHQYDSIVPYIDIDLPKSALYKNRIIMLDIIANNKWKRPIYFSGGSMSKDEYLWMRDYLQLEGMVYKLVPIKTPLPEDGSSLDMGGIDPEKMYGIVMAWDWGNSESPNIYHDPETRRNSLSYRNNLARLMEALINEGKKDKAKKIIDLAMTKMPLEYFGYYPFLTPFIKGYYNVGEKEKARQLIAKLQVKYKQNLDYYGKMPQSNQVEMSGEIGGDLENLRSLLHLLQDNADLELYNKGRKEFNAYNSRFKMVGRKSE